MGSRAPRPQSTLVLRSSRGSRSTHPAEVILAGSIEKAVDHAAGLRNNCLQLAKYEHHLVLDHIRQFSRDVTDASR
jgi:hypothetical protein